MTSTASQLSPVSARFPAFASHAMATAPSTTLARRGRPTSAAFSLLYLDMDSVKLIQDEHGQDVGDGLRCAIAMRLERALRANDAVNYLGGDRFICLVGGWLDHDEVSHLACKLFDTVSAPFKIERLSVSVRPSIGIAMSPSDGNTTEGLLKSAGAAMLRAKRMQSGYAFSREVGGLAIG